MATSVTFELEMEENHLASKENVSHKSQSPLCSAGQLETILHNRYNQRAQLIYLLIKNYR